MNIPIKERIGSNESLYESCPNNMCFIVLRRINVPQIRNDLFQLSIKYFLLFIKVPIKAEMKTLIEPNIGALTSKNIPIEKKVEPRFKKKDLFIFRFNISRFLQDSNLRPTA